MSEVGFLKHRWLVVIPRVSDSVGLESPQMMLTLLVWGPHGELGSKLLGATFRCIHLFHASNVPASRGSVSIG